MQSASPVSRQEPCEHDCCHLARQRAVGVKIPVRVAHHQAKARRLRLRLAQIQPIAKAVGRVHKKLCKLSS